MAEEPEEIDPLKDIDQTDRTLEKATQQQSELLKMIARQRAYFARNVHITDKGERLDFSTWPWGEALISDDRPTLDLIGSTGGGKALGLSTGVLTPDGLKKMGDIRVGDAVMTPFGVPTKVTGWFPHNQVDIYKVEFADGRSIEACGDHLWEVDFDGGPTMTLSTLEVRRFIEDRPTIPMVESDSGRLPFESFTYAGKKDAACITVEHPRKLYVAENNIVTHNSEYGIINDFACAFVGLRVMVVFQNLKKRSDFVGGRIDQLISQSPVYRQLIKDDPSGTDKVSRKNFGGNGGSILYMTAGTENDFTSHRADVLRIDEYQDCNQNFLNIALNRLDGSPYQFIWRLSNTREPGSDDHRNNDWLYQQGDQAVWQVPCPRCSSYQTLDWWDHFIEEKKSKYGAIESIELRDKERADPGAKDPRPICKYCHTPMGRLVRPGVGHWHRKNPAVSAVHGSYRFSNLYNPTTFIRKLYDRYKGCVRNPYLYNRFLNDQLGLTNQNEGDGINAQMLAMTARGEASGVQAYRLQPFRSTI